MLKRQKEFDAYAEKQSLLDAIKDNDFVNIEELSNYFILDMKYATSDNFLKEAVYSCARCYVRGAVAKALIKANKDFMKQGYRIKLFDCYRPHSVQKKMWKIVPDPGYVANPKGGSVHNRGAALDITLTNLRGKELDMGTPFDHFGKEASHSYTKLSKEVIANRKLLRGTMEKYGFKTIRTEWWHYNFHTGKKFKISDFRWKCD
ncbi:M15 family metallopeptidase [Aquimarina sp. 2201CG5-10]|nr:M15 family metallopeptidase [Aquimarina sp. 2201CG5-10]MDY8134717.1 M15 family metallopeptidase [Aquimarina sp. 2201CG5-10]